MSKEKQKGFFWPFSHFFSLPDQFKKGRSSSRSIYIILVAIVIGSGIFLRFWKLDSIPPGIQYDEAFNGINALQALESGDFKVFYPENWGREGFHINVTAIFIRLFGITNGSLRMANALWGSITLVGFFLLLKEFKLSRVTVVLGTFLMAFSFWHLDFSRTAYRAIMVPMLIVWIFFLLFRGLESRGKRKYLCFLASGVLFGLGFHTYIAFRIVPAIVLVMAFGVWMTKKVFWKDNWRHILLFMSSAFLVAWPLGSYFYSHPADFMTRSEAVSIFEDPKSGHLESFSKSLLLHAKAFFVEGDKNPRHNYNLNPLLPAPIAFAFAAGFLLSLVVIINHSVRFFRRKKKQDASEFIPSKLFFPSLLGQSAFWAMLMPGIMTYEGAPHSLRIIGAIPATYLLAALSFQKIEDSISSLPDSLDYINRKKNWTILFWGLTFLVVASGLIQPLIYFKYWADDPRTYSGFEKKLYDLGNLINEMPKKKDNYLITGYNAAVNKEHTQSSYKTTEYIAHPKIKDYQFYRPMDGRTAISCEDPLVVFQDSDQWLRSEYMKNCPGLKQKAVLPKDGMNVFWVLSY